MNNINQHFGFSRGQLAFLAVCAVVALLLGAFLTLRSLAVDRSQEIELPVVVGAPSQSATGVFTLDPNTAPTDSLELLPGIGPVLADRIVAYRQHNVFHDEIDITNVKGIGPRLFERLRPYLRVARQ